jgi:hypothetical protein
MMGEEGEELWVEDIIGKDNIGKVDSNVEAAASASAAAEVQPEVTITISNNRVVLNAEAKGAGSAAQENDADGDLRRLAASDLVVEFTVTTEV